MPALVAGHTAPPQVPREQGVSGRHGGGRCELLPRTGWRRPAMVLHREHAETMGVLRCP
ncbi:hypothetical protein DPMN_025768 [Dreissena polymorpha]|uniref:Uncharacterized protein n=1 Tax=Dreissena polymorpha TaxID=45954 RepID=A0A9D4LRZ1_DREPO|nr:hypothetical protein DPMN_025765 [Dreissena polymorpha]KAH3862794.1 hypothetical protein DPMN_025768 [Dreissena polymorpha]